MSFKSALRNGASKMAEALSLGAAKLMGRTSTYKVDGKIGKKYQPYRRYIDYAMTGPFYLQDGVQANGMPQMIRRYVHRFLHATKGWMTKKAERPTVNLVNMKQPRVYGPRAGASFDHGRFVMPEPLAKHHVQNSARKVLLPYFKKENGKHSMHTSVRLEPYRAPLAA